MIKKKTYHLKFVRLAEDLFYGEKNGLRFGTRLDIVVKSVKEIKRWKTLKKNQYNYNLNTVIEMAWCDKTSFESIKIQTGLLEKDVIKIMRSNLKKTSFKIWRERVYSRKAKHEKISNYNFTETKK